MRYRKKGWKWRRASLKRGVAFTVSASLLSGSLFLSDGLTTRAGGLMSLEQWQQSVSGGNVSGGDTVSGNNGIMSFSAVEQDYTDFTENELIYSFDFGTDVTKSNTYGQWVVDASTGETANLGFLDVEYNNTAQGWVNNVYYPRELSKREAGASYVTNAEGCLAVSSKVWTETESTGYGVYTYENTSAFGMELPNADYSVEVVLTNPTSAAYNAYIEAEDITKVSSTEIPAGESKTLTFTAVLIDGVLDLKFLAESSAADVTDAQTKTVYVSKVKVTRLATQQAGTKPTIYLASDSTVQTYESDYEPQTGWGETLALFFGGEVTERECADCDYSQAQVYEAQNVIVENRAIGGRSSKSFVEEGKLDDLLEDIKPGDYLFVQWGHNDATYSRPNRYVASSDFGDWLQYYIDGALQRGATPVLVTPVARYSYSTDSDGSLTSFHSDFEAYRQVMLSMAAEQAIPLIDLTQRSIALCNSFGVEGAKSLFLWVAAGEYPDGAYAGGASDSTHLQYYGAYKFAQCVAKGIQESTDTALADLKSRVVISIPENVPGDVDNLEITSVGAASVTMIWDVASDAELYYIYRQQLGENETAADVSFANAAKYSASSSNKYTDNSCEAGETYVYAVRGFNEKGLGDFSDKVEVTTKEAGYRFDFNYGTSPTMEGWTGVTQNQMYSASAGYGWITAPGNGRYRADNGNEDSSDMADDFCLGAGEFAVDLPNGDYEVTVYAGDLLPGTSTIKPSYTAEGYALGSISTKLALGSCTNTVRVTDGQLNLTVGGTNAYINGMTVTGILLAPTGLAATELSTNEANATVSFLIGFNGIAEAVSYNVYCKNSTDTDFDIVKTIPAESINDLNYRAMTGSLGETYEYYVTAVTADGTESAPSETITVALVEEGPKAAAPANLVCTSPTENTTQLQRFVSLQWDAVEDAVKYIVYRSDKAEDEKGFREFVKVGESAAVTYTDETVTTHMHYYYKVAALTRTGLGQLSEVCVTPVTGTLVAGGLESYSDRGVTAIYLGGADGAGTYVSATDSQGNELSSGVYVSWRSYEADFDSDHDLTTTFNVYRGNTLIAQNIKVTNLVDEGGGASDTYRVEGSNDSALGLASEAVSVWQNKYLELTLYCPADDTMPDGSTCSYSANDMSVGDLDGDGKLELLVKWYPSNAQDNSSGGYTGKTYIDAYDVNFNTGAASLLWRIDMGVNIRSGAHYTQFQVWDYDGDGKAEIALKAADGTTSYVSSDGTAAGLAQEDYVGACSSQELPVNTISAANDYRNSGGYILEGPEYFAIFDHDGSLIDAVDYLPGRGTVSAWGDAYGNRVDRFLSATAYLNGETPFAVFCRGYYTRTCLTAYYLKDTDEDGIGDTIDTYWTFDTDALGLPPEGTEYEAQGNHGLSVNDVDEDGKDEIIYGALVIDHDGSLKYTTSLGHGDAMHVSDWVSWNDGLEIMSVHEHSDAQYQVEIRDAETGEILMGYHTGQDTGRGVAADIDPTWEGAEWWSIVGADFDGSYEPAWNSTEGEVYSTWSSLSSLITLSDSTPASNFTLFWDGDLLSEIQDHTFNETAYVSTGTVLSKWNYEEGEQETLLSSTEILSNNGTKGNMGLAADILGDWREEIITRTAADKNKVRIYMTTIQTDYVVPCLLENLAYREGVAWQNVGYNQPANVSYLLSQGLVTPKLGDVEAGNGYVEFTFTPGSDGDLYGHEITGYEIYRAKGDGGYTLLDTVDTEELDVAEDEDAQEIIGWEEGDVAGQFDFGNKTTASGFTTVTNGAYSASAGYGFTSAGEINYNRVGVGITPAGETATALETACSDLCRASDELTFEVYLPAGTYQVEVYAGAGYSNSAYNGNSITVNGQNLGTVSQSPLIADMVKTAQVTLEEPGNIVVTAQNSGQLAILNALVITKLTPVYGSASDSDAELKYIYRDTTVEAGAAYYYKVAAVVSYPKETGGTGERTAHMSAPVEVQAQTAGADN